MLSELPATILGRVAVWRPGKHVAVPVVPKLFEQTIPTVNDVRLVQYRVNVFIRHHHLPPLLRLVVRPESTGHTGMSSSASLPISNSSQRRVLLM